MPYVRKMSERREPTARNSDRMSRKWLSALEEKEILRIVTIPNSMIFDDFFGEVSISIFLLFLIDKKTGGYAFGGMIGRYPVRPERNRQTRRFINEL
jgi:hypothetical protein